MLYRVADGKIILGSNLGETYFSFPLADFADIAHICADDATRSLIVTAAKNPSDVADVMANQRGNYRAYRVDAGEATRLTNEYTNTAVPLSDGSIAYSNGSNLVVRSETERRAWKTGRFSWGPVAISCSRDAAIIAMTKWKGDDRKLFTVDRATGLAATSTFSYYSYVLNDRMVYYALGGGVKQLSLVTGETELLTGKTFTKALLAAFGATEPPASVKIDFTSVTRFQGRLLAGVRLYTFRESDYVALGRGVISWTPGQTDVCIEYNMGERGIIDTVISDGDTAVVSYRTPVGLPPHEFGSLAFGRSAELLNSGWHFAGNASFPNHGFQFLPG